MDWSIIQSNSWIIGGLFAAVFLFVGVVLGKFVSYVMEKIGEKIDMKKKIRSSFLKLIITLIRWSIYLIFLNLAFTQLPIYHVTNFATNILLAIPFFIGAVILVVLGFVVGNYLREIIEEAQIKNGNFLSMYLFYFVIFVSGVYALRIALSSFENIMAGYIILIPVIAFVVGATYHVLRNK